jgi:hypothetical protein
VRCVWGWMSYLSVWNRGSNALGDEVEIYERDFNDTRISVFSV